MSFHDDMKAFARQTHVAFDKVVRGTIIDMSTRIIQRTPVGNADEWKGPAPEGYLGGQAKGNWFAGIGEPTDEVNMGAVSPSGSVSVSRVTQAAPGAVGKVYYLVNSLPYISRLEYDGWSGQAPNGMVRVTVAEYDEAIAKQLRDLR